MCTRLQCLSNRPLLSKKTHERHLTGYSNVFVGGSPLNDFIDYLIKFGAFLSVDTAFKRWGALTCISRIWIRHPNCTSFFDNSNRVRSKEAPKPNQPDNRWHWRIHQSRRPIKTSRFCCSFWNQQCCGGRYWMLRLFETLLVVTAWGEIDSEKVWGTVTTTAGHGVTNSFSHQFWSLLKLPLPIDPTQSKQIEVSWKFGLKFLGVFQLKRFCCCFCQRLMSVGKTGSSFRLTSAGGKRRGAKPLGTRYQVITLLFIISVRDIKEDVKQQPFM